MAARIVNQAADHVSEMLADTIKTHLDGVAFDPEFPTFPAIPAHCTVDAPCDVIARYLKVLNGEGRINGINRIAAIDLPREHRPAGTGHGTKRSATVGDASDKQMAFARKLIAERDFHSLIQEHRVLVGRVNNGEMLNWKEVRSLIDALLATAYSTAVSTNGFQKDRTARVQAADAKRRAELVELEVGIYRVEDSIYKVQKAVHGSGNLYAKVLVVDSPSNAHFDYAPGAIRKIRPEHRMDLESAKQFGAIYGVCCHCSKTLTDENSIEAGIGPVCARKFAA